MGWIRWPVRHRWEPICNVSSTLRGAWHRLGPRQDTTNDLPAGEQLALSQLKPFSLLLTLQPREAAGWTAESGTGERLVRALTGKNSRAENKVLALVQKCLFPELRAPGPGGAGGDRVSWKDAATTLIPATAASWESGPTVARSPRFFCEIPDF